MEQLKQVGPGNMIQDVIAKMGQDLVGELVDELETICRQGSSRCVAIPVLHHFHECGSSHSTSGFHGAYILHPWGAGLFPHRFR